ncbi:nucleotidyltransferase domain-containing protein [Kribbella sp. VKM Ac-2568]|uniref:nucleotidyltransferase domain-containing protein n=1 Tax=Kribbella sp. VKM Ac-2568 TaxID=2512219 RepID=UPI0010D0FB03|nr:nucleotidyltransferase domain-containing protein [Kribbella sp. VKM Ac-2568]TCM49267.1 streptomycin adenylyltransferase [Kribbella sp. VKM Ac-2568]
MTINPTGDARQQLVIERARTVLPEDDRILAVYLAGSYGTGEADEFSDVDVHCVITDDSVPWFEEHWTEAMTAIAGPTVLTDRIPGLLGGLGITPDWLHVDLVLHPSAGFDRFQYDGIRVLFDRDGSHLPDGDQPRAGGRPGTPYWPEREVRLFFYFLGNLVTVLGRDEQIVGHQGIGAVRDQLIALMLAERGVRRTGGAKRLNAYLSDEQRTCLEGIPSAGCDPADIVAANRYLCREFIRRGKALAEVTGEPWPQAFVDATLAHLHRHFGVPF